MNLLKQPITYEYEFSGNIDYKYQRIAIFATHSDKCIIEEYVIYYLSKLRETVDAIIFIADNSIHEEELQKIKDLVCFCSFKSHREYDFGSYKIGFNYAKEKGLLKEQVVFCNDSCIGPFKSFSDFFEKIPQGCDFFGMTKNLYGMKHYKNKKYYSIYFPHIQSYFFVLTKKVFMSNYFEEFINSVKEENHKNDVIINYELGLTKLLMQNRIVPKAFSEIGMKYDPTFFIESSILNGFLLKKFICKRNKLVQHINLCIANTNYPYLLKKNFQLIMRRKIAVHLHIFYEDQIDKMLFYVSNIWHNSKVIPDLFITINDESITKKLKESSIKTNIYVVPNKGHDVAPFLYVLNKINLNDYDYIIKIHTKNSKKSECKDLCYSMSNGHIWSETMLDALLKKDSINRNLLAFENDKNLGMIGAASLIVEEKKFEDEVLHGIPREVKRIGISIPKAIKFVAGNMFMVRSKLLKSIQESQYTFDDFEESKNVKDGTLAHILERIFGAAVLAQGYKIKGFDWNLKWFLQEILFKLRFFLFTQKITNNERRIIKICKIPVYSKQNKKVLIIKKSRFFDREWYLNQYPEIKKSKYSPEIHYLRYGWKKGYNPSKIFNTYEYLSTYPKLQECPLLHYERELPNK